MEFKHYQHYVDNIDLLSYDAIYEEMQYCTTKSQEYYSKKDTYTNFSVAYKYTGMTYKERATELSNIYAILLDDEVFNATYKSIIKNRIDAMKIMFYSDGTIPEGKEPDWEQIYKQVLQLNDISFLRELEYMMARRKFGESHQITISKKNELEVSKNMQELRKVVSKKKVYK